MSGLNQFTNNASTTLASGVSIGATSLTVASGTGMLFPTLAGSQYFYCTLANLSATALEIVKVTARSGDVFTIVRGQDGQPNVGFTPFPIHGEQKTGTTIALAKKNVVYSYEPAEDFKSNYNQIFGSGLVVPPQKSIITG